MSKELYEKLSGAAARTGSYKEIKEKEVNI